MENDVIRVLLVDDDAAYVAVARHLLSQVQGKNFDLIWKKDGDEALEELKSNRAIEIILMDYLLPRKSGLEIARQLREQKIDIPVIFLTTHKDFHAVVEAMKYGVHDYLVKDEAMDTVLPKTILSVLERVQLKNQIADAEKQKLIAQKRAEAIQELIVAVCHEFNNPLAAIKICAEIISRQQLAEEGRMALSKFNANLSMLEKEVLRLRNIHWDMDSPKGG